MTLFSASLPASLRARALMILQSRACGRLTGSISTQTVKNPEAPPPGDRATLMYHCRGLIYVKSHAPPALVNHTRASQLCRLNRLSSHHLQTFLVAVKPLHGTMSSWHKIHCMIARRHCISVGIIGWIMLSSRRSSLCARGKASRICLLGWAAWSSPCWRTTTRSNYPGDWRRGYWRV